MFLRLISSCAVFQFTIATLEKSLKQCSGRHFMRNVMKSELFKMLDKLKWISSSV